MKSNNLILDKYKSRGIRGLIVLGIAYFFLMGNYSMIRYFFQAGQGDLDISIINKCFSMGSVDKFLLFLFLVWSVGFLFQDKEKELKENLAVGEENTKKYFFSKVILIYGVSLIPMLINIFIKLKITDADLLGNDYLAIYDSVRINGITVWKYVLKSRMKWLVFLVLAGITKIRIPIYALFTMAAGAGSGILISIMVLKYGLMGIAVFLISIFPQFIFYGIMYVLMLKIFIESTGLVGMRKNLILAGIVIAMFIAGTYMEAFLNPIALKKMYMLIF